MVGHQKNPPLIIIREIVWKQELSLIGTTYRLRIPKTGIQGRVVGEVNKSVNRQTVILSSYQRDANVVSEDSCQSCNLLEVRIQGIISKIQESILWWTQVLNREIQNGLSRNGQDEQNRIFALKLNNHFCPMTSCQQIIHRSFFGSTLTSELEKQNLPSYLMESIRFHSV